MIELSERTVRALMDLRRDRKAILCVVLAMADSTPDAIRRLEDIADVNTRNVPPELDKRLALEAGLLAEDLLPWARKVATVESG